MEEKGQSEEQGLICKMQPEDIATIALLERLNFSNPWSEEAIAKTLAYPNSVLLVYKEQQEILGYCGLVCMMPEADLVFVCTKAEARRRGIAKKLIAACIEEGRKKGVEEVYLEVRESNLSARCLYQSIGFEAVGIRKGYYEKPKEDAILMKFHSVL